MIRQCSSPIVHGSHDWDDGESTYTCLGRSQEPEWTAESVLADYFENDREGWKRPYTDWAKRARKVLDS